MSKGYVYVITIPGRTVAKIGISRHRPTQRLKQLQTGSPDQLRLYAYRFVEDYEDVEREVHRRLGCYRVIGEWFDVSPTQALSVLNAVIAERRRPVYRQFQNVWEGLQTFIVFLILCAGFSWLWWYYDGYHRFDALTSWYRTTYGDFVIVAVPVILIWLVFFIVKRFRRTRKRRKN